MSDTHGGSKFGLLNPETILRDEDQDGNEIAFTPASTGWNRYLWDCFAQDVKEAEKFADGDRIHIKVLGDVTHGHFTSDVITHDITHQFTMAAYNLYPLARLPNVASIRINDGTESHDFMTGASSKTLAQHMSFAFPKINVTSLAHGLSSIQGVKIDYSHHGPGAGIRVWLRGNNVRFYTQNIMMEDIIRREDPPNLILRGHVHNYVYETVRIPPYTTRVVVLPSYCGMNYHARKVTKSTYRVTNGMIAFEVIDGRLSEPVEFIRTRDLRRTENLDEQG